MGSQKSLVVYQSKVRPESSIRELIQKENVSIRMLFTKKIINNGCKKIWLKIVN